MNGLKWLPTLITFAPLLGVIILAALPVEKSVWHRRVGILATLPSLLLSLVLYDRFQPGVKGLQAAFSHVWFQIPLPMAEPLTFYYSMGVDGLSIPLVLLTSIVTPLAAIASMYVRHRTKAYYSLLLLLQTGMTGVFLVTDFFLFFLFFEITLVALFFLIGIWGYLRRERAANLFLLYNGLGSAFLLFALAGFLILFQTVDFATLQERIGIYVSQMNLLPEPARVLMWLIFASLLIAFAIKLPVFPLHSWMLGVHTEAPTPVVMIHSGILLKIGAYGLIRFGIGFFPSFMKEVSTLFAMLGLISILYGAVLAFVETEWKRVLAYSSVSHMGVILFGIASLNQTGLQGAVFQAVSHGLISALFFFLVGSLAERTRTTYLNELGGLARSMPVLSGLFLTAGLALLGLPGLSGFISEFLAFTGLFKVKPWIAGIGTLGLVLAAVYTLRAVLKTSFGPVRQRFEEVEDVRPLEVVPMLILVGMIVWIGVYPAVLGDPTQQTIQLIVSKIGG